MTDIDHWTLTEVSILCAVSECYVIHVKDTGSAQFDWQPY